MHSSLSSTPRIARTFSCKRAITLGESRKIPIASDDATASSGGIAALKTNDVPLIRWCSVTIREAAQNAPAELKTFAHDPMRMSTDGAGTLYSSVRPRPVRPTVPKEKDSSTMSRNLYFSLSSICNL